ncbi:MAG TPA: NYN domain-containing protein [Candidatus Limnocylindria bacterium]|nr:NYN domain-containing protein [Candidatus Limnocylindria bacterium]
MSKNVAMFVDVANMYYAARGQDVDVDYVALLKHATKGRDLIRAYAYTGLDPENENQRKFIDFLAKNGYKPVVKDIRKFGDGRMKANLDIELVVDLFRLSDRMDIAVIVSGDGDFAPAIRALQDTGVRCEVISFKPNTSSDLVAVADEFMDIMKIASISRGKGTTASRTSMSAPEMPAKEVSPEFGFREASPSVAAAALAALKTGGSGNGRRTRGGAARGAAARSGAVRSEGSRSAATPAEEPPGEKVSAATTEAGEEVRRRRRRRGGRGRGRARRDEESTAPVATGGEEIGWEEFDDLSQLDGAPETDREFTFEEADAATLAELGIDSSTAAAPAEGIAEEAGAEEKPKRRRTTKKAQNGEAADAAAEEKPKRRSRATAATSKADEAAEAKPKRSRSTRASTADAATEEKPKRRSRAKAADASERVAQAGDAVADGEPQGIWGRFRSARKPRSTT